MRVFRNDGLAGGAKIALSYALLGAFAMSVAHSGLPQLLADWFINKIENNDLDAAKKAKLVAKWGMSKEQVAAILRARGAIQLPRTTQGGGIKALTLWSLRNHEHWKAKSARARVAIFLHHHAMANPFDPLAI